MIWKDGLPPGLRFSILSRTFKQKMDEQAMRLGLTAVQLRVLGEICLLEEDGTGEEVHPKRLEEIEKVTHPTMNGIIKQLEGKGFIECEPSAVDHRYKKIVTTSKTKDIPRLIKTIEDSTFSELCAGISLEELEEFYRVTDIMIENTKRKA